MENKKKGSQFSLLKMFFMLCVCVVLFLWRFNLVLNNFSENIFPSRKSNLTKKKGLQIVYVECMLMYSGEFWSVGEETWKNIISVKLVEGFFTKDFRETYFWPYFLKFQNNIFLILWMALWKNNSKKYR